MAKAATQTSVALSEKKGTSLMTTDESFEAFAGAGLENVTAKDLIIPRITILQALSPQINPKKPEYIKGANVGDICEVSTGQIFEAPFVFLPVHYMKQWLEWAPRASGKGLVAIHNDDLILETCTRDEKGRPFTKDGNLISETAQFFGLNLSAGGNPRCFLPMASTQLKRAKKWVTLANSERATRKDGSEYIPPLFYRTYNLSTTEEGNAQGDWVGWKVERGSKLQEWADNWSNLFNEAMDFRKSIAAGEVRGDLQQDDEAPAGNDAAM